MSVENNNNPPSSLQNFAPQNITIEWIRRNGYKGFGSFFSDNVEEILNSPHYSPPPYPPFTDLTPPEQTPTYGRDVKKYFLLEEDFTFINHGAFGAVPAPILSVANSWREEVEKQPLRFIDRKLLPLLVDAGKRLAEFLHLPANEVVLLPNATSALNSVIHSIVNHPSNCNGEVQKAIFLLDICYGSLKLMVQRNTSNLRSSSSSSSPPVVLQLSIPLPSTHSQLLSLFEEFIRENHSSSHNSFDSTKPQIELAIFDHITSYSAWLLPIKEMIEICRKYQIKTLIDGAHSLGSISNLRIGDYNADFFVGNCHKWFLSPKGCGFLHCRREFQSIIHSVIISWGSSESNFYSQFIWDGTRDYSAALSMKSVLQFWELYLGGFDRAHTYMKNLLISACELLTSAWSTRTLFNDLNVDCAMMALVELPESSWILLYNVDQSENVQSLSNAPMANSTYGKIVQDRLFYHHKVEVPIKHIRGKLYARISAHVYNDISDFQRFSEAILNLW